MGNQPKTELVRAGDLRPGDSVLLSSQQGGSVTIALETVYHFQGVDFCQSELHYQIQGNGPEGIKRRLMMPSIAMLPRVIKPPAIRKYQIVGNVFLCESYDRVVAASSQDEAEKIAGAQVEEDWANLHEFCINEVNEVQDD
jgi:hypothetical protein